MSGVSLAPDVSPVEHARRGSRAAARIDHATGEALRRWIAAPLLGALATLVYGPGHLGYDTGWSMLWGKQIAAGQLPSFQAPGAPTPHPLSNVLAAALAPLGDAAGEVVLAIAALSFGVLVQAGFLLGARTFGRSVGLAFAAILFTRPGLINAQAQALVDMPFVACVVLAAALEAARPRRGGAVLVLLTLAGLLRPEGWLIMGAYALYLLPASDLGTRVRVLGIAAIAPVTWATFDLVVTGDPLYSLHGTQQLAAELDRPRELADALVVAPAALSDMLGTPLAVVGLAGCLAGVLLLYRRALLPTALIGVGLLCFLGLGVAGLPVLDRYLIVPAIMLGLFAAVALLGWSALERGDRRRLPWAIGAALVAAALALDVPATVREDRAMATFLAQRRAIERDLHDVSAAVRRSARPGLPVHVTTRRAVPLLITWLDVRPAAVSANQPPRGASVLLVRHASPAVGASYYSLTTPAWTPVPDPTVRWRELYRNGSWVLYASAPAGA
jgi:hypothetical protein